jgi:hypothetical protein
VYFSVYKNSESNPSYGGTEDGQIEEALRQLFE